MAQQAFPIVAPLAEPPRAGSGALLPTLGRLVTEVQNDREVAFTTNPESCGASGVLAVDPCVVSASKTVPSNESTLTAWSFEVWAGDKCSPWELGRDWQGRARRQLAATLSYQVAHELWTGTIALAEGAPNIPLASIESDVLTAGPTSATDALAVLEYALGSAGKGQRGVLHATRHALTYWSQLGLLRREGGLILTMLDTLVVADAGYDGSGPDGQPAIDGSQWAYATLLPIVRLGPEVLVPDGDLSEALDRATNTVEYRAERRAAVGFVGCVHLAAELDLGWADIGGLGS